MRIATKNVITILILGLIWCSASSRNLRGNSILEHSVDETDSTSVSVCDENRSKVREFVDSDVWMEKDPVNDMIENSLACRDFDSLADVALCLFEGCNTPQKKSKGKKYLKIASDQGSHLASVYLSQISFSRGRLKEYLSYLEISIEQGSEFGRFEMGYFLFHGKSFNSGYLTSHSKYTDRDRGRVTLVALAEEGFSLAAFWVAKNYFEGNHGFHKDRSKARYYCTLIREETKVYLGGDDLEYISIILSTQD
ncbi:hypothetical protein [Sanyastnella coralliicola]|uniref:hypothetical protein n=1 Tax=Sanyastnella coralliicola TaxID=3069118 RepID=UPI0027B8CA95|nr:hypothetical protein [Longitalea sp. SCSIO 12813]